jgi:Flp pilus assembly protein TadD
MTVERSRGRLNDGISLREKGDHLGAEMAFRDAIRLNPDCAEAHWRLGWVLLQREKNLDAGAEFQSALRINPDSAAAHEGLGLVLFNEGRHAAAEAEYRQAIRLAPENAIASSRLAESLFAQNRYIDAEIAARDAIRAAPGLSVAHVSLGQALQRLGQTAGAEQALRTGVRLDPRSAGARLALGSLLGDTGRPLEAEAELREAIRLAPSDAKTHRALGRLLSSLGRDSEASAEFRTAIRLAPGDASVQPDLTALERELGDPTRKWRYRAALFRHRRRQGQQARKRRTTVAPAVLLRSPRARPLHRFTAGLMDDLFVPLYGPFMVRLFLEPGAWLPLAIVTGAACVAANGYLEGRTGRSFGKGAVGLRTIDAETGRYVGGGKGALRRELHLLDYPLGFLVGLRSGRTFADRLTGTIVIWRPKGVTTRSRRKIAAMEREHHRRLNRGYRRAGRGYFFLNLVLLDIAGHWLRYPGWLLWHLTRRRPKRAYYEDDVLPQEEEI